MCILCWWLYRVYRRCNSLYEVIKKKYIASRLCCRQYSQENDSENNGSCQNLSLLRRPTCLSCRGRSSQVCLADLRPALPPPKSVTRRRGWSRRASPPGPRSRARGRPSPDRWQKEAEAADLRWSPGLRAFTSSDTAYPSSGPHRGPLTEAALHYRCCARWVTGGSDPPWRGWACTSQRWRMISTSDQFFFLFLTLTAVA